MAKALTCPLCNSTKLQPVVAFGQLPVLCNQLWDSPEKARHAPTGDIDLTICNQCAMIWNTAFDPDLMAYATDYENALHFSPVFQDFADALVADLTRRYDLAGGTVFEIGCGDGFMLARFMDHGAGRAIGFDPSMQGRSTEFTQRAGVTVIPAYFDIRHLTQRMDILLCRHVLEHIQDPADFLRGIAQALGPRDVPLYFEVPNTGWLMAAPSPWDVIYEHVGYWSAPAIDASFRRAGFSTTSVSTAYNGQFLQIEARSRPSNDRSFDTAKVADVVALAGDFAQAYEQGLTRWKEKLSDFSRGVVIWGAGSKGITFANILGQAGCQIDALVDLNPRKHGRYIPGVGLPVISPEDLAGYAPSLVLISNGLYADEIKAQVRAAGLSPQFAEISV